MSVQGNTVLQGSGGSTASRAVSHGKSLFMMSLMMRRLQGAQSGGEVGGAVAPL